MLREYFEARGIPLGDFAGQAVPLRFSNVAEEHLATRRAAGLFDFSFMGCFDVAGRDAFQFLNFLQTRNLASLREGRACYTLLCNKDGTVINDATVWRHSSQHFWVFTGRREDWYHIAAIASSFDVALTNLSGHFAAIAVQGPQAPHILERFLGQPLPKAYFSFSRATVFAKKAWVARLGYTGELGFELLVPAVAGAEVWSALLAVGDGIHQCGFDAANSLRIEAGYILFTCELAKPATPYELGLGRLVELPRSSFVGSAALEAARFRPPTRTLVGLRFASVIGKRDTGNMPGADVTSESDSPILRKRVGLGFAPYAQRFPGSVVRASAGQVAIVSRLPFYDPPRALSRSKLASAFSLAGG
jgi:aminomethyltransferase